jgi:hypothetical protein
VAGGPLASFADITTPEVGAEPTIAFVLARAGRI